MLDVISKEIKQVQAEEPDEPETRSMAISYQAMTCEFQELMNKTRVIRDQFKNSLKGKVVRQVRLIDENLTEEQVEQLADDPQAFQKLVASKTLGATHVKLQYAVSDIIDKYKEIQNLEKSVQYILKLLNEIAILVHEQGEYMNNIEKDLAKAKHYLEKGVKTLEKKKVAAVKSRKRLCCILLISLFVMALIAIPIALKIKSMQ